MSAESIHLLNLPLKHRPADISPQGTGSGLDADKLDGLHANQISVDDYKYLVVQNGTSADVYDATGTKVNSGAQTTMLQWALDNLTATRTSKEKVIAKGNFTVNIILSVSSYTTFSLIGKLTAKNALNSAMLFAQNTQTDIEVRGGEYDGNKANQTIEQSILTISASRTIIEGCHIHHGYGDSIEVGYGASDVQIINNYCHDSYEQEIHVNSSGATMTNIVVALNICENNQTVEGILIGGSTGTLTKVTVSANICNGNHTNGITIGYAGGTLREVTVCNNVCDGNVAKGIYVLNGETITVEANNCRANQDGLRASTSGADVLIVSNTLSHNTRYGLDMVNMSGLAVIANYVDGNTSYGLHSYTCTYCSIVGNTLLSNGASGIDISDGSNYNHIASNMVKGSTGAGILLWASNGNMILGNTSTGNSTYGIRLDGDSNLNVIHGNATFTNTTACARLNTNTEDNNRIWGNNFDEGNISDAGTGTVAFDNFDPSAGTWITSINAPTGGR